MDACNVMDGFQDITLTYKGVDYTLKANRMLPVVAQIEDAIRGDSARQAVQILLQPGGPSYPRLAMAYAAALRGAGAGVSADEIYLSIMQDFADGNSDAAEGVQRAIFTLLSIMSPPIARALAEGADEPGEAQAAGS
jgi:hypothetical protein